MTDWKSQLKKLADEIFVAHDPLSHEKLDKWAAENPPNFQKSEEKEESE